MCIRDRFLAVLCFPAQVLGLLTSDTAVITEGVKYLQIICSTYLIFTATNVLTASLRAIGIVKIGYMISASTLCINVVLNYCLIYGSFGFPRLGIRGAAIATLVSRCVELLIVIWYLKYKEKQLKLTLKKLVMIDKSYYKDYRRVALPVLDVYKRQDGCGGATGSSKVHTEESIETCGAEVQKGNAPTERKIQRMFRREEVSRLIKKCNDFGAGGVSVAIGELADGLRVNLDKVPKKYAGLDGTEIAISESQERMAVAVSYTHLMQQYNMQQREL